MNSESFNILEKLKESIRAYPENLAFFIKGKSYTYRQFQARISGILQRIQTQIPLEEKYVGILSLDHFDTYASVFALWISGKAFVPLNPLNPTERNQSIISQMELKHILYAGKLDGLNLESSQICINTAEIPDSDSEIIITESSGLNDAYVLFTSGSTGTAKGVRISRKSLDAFYKSYTSFGPPYSSSDRFLQIYDISFDGSIPCYLVPLCTGASVFTVPQDEIKYLYALKLMKDNDLTVVKMTPSLLTYLKPYFTKINLPAVRCCIFGGEALPLKLTEEWMKCIPNSLIQNAYGPTEATVDALMYTINPGQIPIKSLNNVISLGCGFGDFKYKLINSEGQEVIENEVGELCLNSDQLMTSYWNDEEKTNKAFITLPIDEGEAKFYRTGDLASVDSDGFYFYHDRIDNQVQIQGYRVELGEVESQAGKVSHNPLAAVVVKSKRDIQIIVLFVEGNEFSTNDLIAHFNAVLPAYMIPSKIIFLSKLPVLNSGKIDRKKLTEMALLYEDN